MRRVLRCMERPSKSGRESAQPPVESRRGGEGSSTEGSAIVNAGSRRSEDRHYQRAASLATKPDHAQLNRPGDQLLRRRVRLMVEPIRYEMDTDHSRDPQDGANHWNVTPAAE